MVVWVSPLAKFSFEHLMEHREVKGGRSSGSYCVQTPY